MAIDIDILKNEIDEQWYFRWPYFKDIVNNSGNEDLIKILNSKEYINLYDREDIDTVIEEYITKIHEIRHLVFNSNKLDKQNILRLLEYMRHMHSHENIEIEIEEMGVLSQAPIIQAFSGKGVCSSQVRLMRDILPEKMKPKILTVQTKKEKDSLQFLEDHSVLLVTLDNEKYFIDPTLYTGNKESLNIYEGIVKQKNWDFKTIEASEDEIKESRDEIQEKLIKKLKIDKISREIIDSKMTDLEKHCAIFTFIENRIKLNNYDVQFSIAELFGKNIEVGKLMELFFVANGINYKIECVGDKSETRYNVELNDKKVSLFPRKMYDSSKPRGENLTENLHYIKDGDQKEKYLYTFLPEIQTLYDELIKKGREKTESVDLSKLEQEDDLKDKQNTKKRDYFNDEVEL